MTLDDAVPLLLADILAMLPQTQCTACGHPGCAPFATAVAAGQSPTEGCTPGGLPLRLRLDRLLGRAATASVNAASVTALPTPLRAVIRAADCIGCTKCIAPCPVDAIIGAAGQLHTVITAQCTGCGLCLPPCPVDCIELAPVALPFIWPTDATPAALAVAAGASIAACTQCGDCASVCPSWLEPARLAQVLAQADTESAVALRLADCTECAKCDEACGERIPLAAYFTQGKSMLAAVAWQAGLAAHSAVRHATHLLRRAAPRTGQEYVPTPASDARARDEIAAVRERLDLRRARGGPGT